MRNTNQANPLPLIVVALWVLYVCCYCSGCNDPHNADSLHQAWNAENRRVLETSSLVDPDWQARLPTPPRQRFCDLVARTRVGDSFVDFLAQVERPDVRIAATAAYGPTRVITFDWGGFRDPRYVVVEYEGDTIVGLDRGGIPGAELSN